MIEGKVKTEASYRAIQMDSSSSLKEFSMDRKKYYKKYFLNERVEETDTKASVVGRIVETLLLEPEEFDGRFYMSVCTSSPTGRMSDFVEALYKHTSAATVEGVVTREMDDLMKDAYTDSGFKIKFESVVSKFVGSDAEIFYKEMREVKTKGLTVITADDVSNAERVVEELKNNSVTSEIINLVNSARYSIHNQLQMEGYSVDGHTFKSMMDKVVVDHNAKTVQVYDLKCVWAVEGFYDEYYLYRRAYIQAYLYKKAAHYFAEQEGLEDFEILNPKFIVCDSTNYYNPLVYTLSDVDVAEAYEGFEHKGRKYPGVKQLIKDLQWAIENNTWNISRENYINNGVVNIKGGK
jgi:hypothetical protein